MKAFGEPGFFEEFLDEEWLARGREPPVSPEEAVLDPHHHLLGPPTIDYGPQALLADLRSGHEVLATVHIEAHGHYRTQGPDPLRVVGETEYIAGVARNYATARIAAGIVGAADMLLGDAVADVLDAHIAAGDGRFRGVRLNLWRDDAFAYSPPPPADWAENPQLRRAVAQLAPRALTADVTVLHHQLVEFARFADAFPQTTFIVNHFGMPLAVGPYAARQDEVMRVWSEGIAALAERPNIVMKLGGTCNPMVASAGLTGLRDLPAPLPSDELAQRLRPLVARCVEAFGAERCMFESNFPVDRAYVGYTSVWNALKKSAAGLSSAERARLLRGTAAEVYRIDLADRAGPT